MIKADIYLKDGVDGIAPLLNEFRNIGAIDTSREYRIEQLLRAQVKPTLTEDEKVILKNCEYNVPNIYDKFETIKREKDGTLNIYGECGVINSFSMYRHLFQFIQPRRRI